MREPVPIVQSSLQSRLCIPLPPLFRGSRDEYCRVNMAANDRTVDSENQHTPSSDINRRQSDGLNNFAQISDLRRAKWIGIPKSPGVYRWYFPPSELRSLKVSEFTNESGLRLRQAPNNFICLYHGMANNLRERVQWHAEQKLTRSVLSSGFLSTFRFTLLALNDFDFFSGDNEINLYFDDLLLEWTEATSREEALQLERIEFTSGYHFPLNIQGNRSTELAAFLKHLKGTRKSFKNRNLMNTNG